MPIMSLPLVFPLFLAKHLSCDKTLTQSACVWLVRRETIGSRKKGMAG